MAKEQKKGMSKRRLVLGVFLTVLVAGVFIAAAAEKSAGDLARQNLYLRQILHYFGKEPVDVYASIDDVKVGKPAFAGAKVLPPVTILDKQFYRIKDATGQITYVAPGAIAAVRPAPGVAPEE